MTETKEALLVLNEGQARYLNELSRAANDYKRSWDSLISRGQSEIENLNGTKVWANGPSHQIMAEVQQEYGALKVLFNVLWSTFTVLPFDEADRPQVKKEIDEFVQIACGEPKKWAGLGGSTFFLEGKTVADYRKDEEK